MNEDMLMAAEYAGRTRGLGTGIAAKKAFTPASFTKLGSNVDFLGEYRKALQYKFDHIRKRRPQLLEALGSAPQEAL